MNAPTLTLTTRVLGRVCEWHESLPSTQTEALSRVHAGAVHGTVVWAHDQTAGRGRRGRSWLSEKGGSLTFSLILKDDIRAEKPWLYSFTAGVGLQEALAKLTGENVQLKWPNDLYLNGRKVGGMLTSLETEPLAVVVGIGINTSYDPTRTDAALKAGAFVGAAVDHAHWLSEILASLEAAFDTFAQRGEPWLQARYRQVLALLGEKVHVVTPHGMVEGVVQGVDEQFGLIVKSDKDTHTIDVGDVWPVEQRE